MAQHIPLPVGPFEIIFKQNNPEKYRDLEYFQRVKFHNGTICLLTRDYNENVAAGLKADEYVLLYEPDFKKGAMEEGSYEIHFNYRNKINKVYYVI